MSPEVSLCPQAPLARLQLLWSLEPNVLMYGNLLMSRIRCIRGPEILKETFSLVWTFGYVQAPLASYWPSTYQLIWDSWKSSQIIPHALKHSVWHQNQVYSLFRIIDTILLLAEGLGLLQPVHPVLYSQISLRVLKMVPNDLSFAKRLQ